MKIRLSLYTIVIFIIGGSLSAQNIVVNDTYTAQQLVEDVLINGPCATVSNFSASGDTFSGEASYGYFTNTSPLFPFSDGIVLSTARAKRSEGPNDNLVDEGSINWVGDQDLEGALQIDRTVNATVLEFDFIPLTNQISFDYIFASEEYSGIAPCRYSDGFAFLLKPANSTEPYRNLAVLPNSNTSVLVTTVHPFIDGTRGCEAQNEQYFGGYNDSSYPVNFNGQTVVLTAKATVIPGTVYHIKLVIADEENIRYDSAIFLKGSSFNIGTDIGPDRLESLNNPLCEGENLLLEPSIPFEPTHLYQWFKDDVAIPGENNRTYNVVSQGLYRINVDLGNGCIAEGESAIEYAALPALTPLTLIQCDDDNDGITSFDLLKIKNLVTLGDTSLSVSYYQTLANAQAATNSIATPSAYRNESGNTVYIRVSNVFGCVAYSTVVLQISNQTVASVAPIVLCDLIEPQDGKTEFDLDLQVTPQVIIGLPPGLTVRYFSSEQDAILQTNPLPNNYSNSNPNQQEIYALILNGADCYGIIPVTLVVNSFGFPNLQDETVYFCESGTVTVTAPGLAPVWDDGFVGSSITVDTAGNYNVVVTDANGCTRSKKFTVVQSGTATITAVNINDFNGGNNTVTIIYEGIGKYEFSLDGINFQENSLFYNVAPGEYTVVIRDLNGCLDSDPLTIYVLDYPKFFTPNGDGINDVWKIAFLEKIPKSRLYIFDRFGKLIFSFLNNDSSWNGTLNGANLPSSDYWFMLQLENGRTIRNHFSLKR